MEPVKCIFCDPDLSNVILQNSHSYVRYDGFPVSPGHALIIPHRHVSSLFDLTDEECESVWKLLQSAKKLIETKYRPDGFNVGVNIGQAAGQTIEHLHIHLIPRYRGDMSDPRGGVRGVIPSKQQY
ncbi:AP-4-A phosphorylase [anaerobic digester metagenome]